MKFREHLKAASYIGFLVGFIIGIVDIIDRFIVGGFEWFELYQTLFISVSPFILFFIFLNFFTELIMRIVHIKITKKKILIFQATNALIILILFYSGILINLHLLAGLSFWSPASLKANFFVFIVTWAIYVWLLIKGKNMI